MQIKSQVGQAGERSKVAVLKFGMLASNAHGNLGAVIDYRQSAHSHNPPPQVTTSLGFNTNNTFVAPVVCSGRVVEHGTHNQLMQLSGDVL